MPKYKPRGVPVKRSSLSVRLAFFNMGFDAAKEWVMAYRQLEDPEKTVKALEKAFEFLYPKMNAVSEDDVQKTIDMIEDGAPDLIESSDDSYLLEALRNGVRDKEKNNG